MLYGGRCVPNAPTTPISSRCHPRSEATKHLFIAIRSYAVRRKDETQKQQILKFFHKNKTEQV